MPFGSSIFFWSKLFHFVWNVHFSVTWFCFLKFLLRDYVFKFYLKKMFDPERKNTFASVLFNNCEERIIFLLIFQMGNSHRSRLPKKLIKHFSIRLWIQSNNYQSRTFFWGKKISTLVFSSPGIRFQQNFFCFLLFS